MEANVNTGASLAYNQNQMTPVVAASSSQVRSVMNLKNGAVHFAGIGGIGMSALARILLSRGYQVSGSDKQESEITDELKDMGAKIFIGHKRENMEAAQAGSLIVSTAIVEGNPELSYAREKNLPVYHRSDLLGYLAQSEKLISVTGTHGKTTTTAMVGQVLIECGLDPSIVVGGIFEHIGANSRSGKGGYFVAESDESDGTHVKANSFASIITNIEPDHLENYPGGFADILSSMVTFVENTSDLCIVCTDDGGVRDLLGKLQGNKTVKAKIIKYGKQSISKDADYSFEPLDGFDMVVYKGQQKLGQVAMRVPGEHNKYNALAAMALAMELGQSFETAAKAAGAFAGVDRRFQLIGKCGQDESILVVDDYAHHPTEVVALLKAAKEFVKVERAGRGRVVCVFQPHQPGRLRDLWNEFLIAFDNADLAFINDVYIARGGAIEGINSETFVKAVGKDSVKYIGGKGEALADNLLPHLKDSDLVLTVGAGDITKLGPVLVNKLNSRIKEGRK